MTMWRDLEDIQLKEICWTQEEEKSCAVSHVESKTVRFTRRAEWEQPGAGNMEIQKLMVKWCEASVQQSKLILKIYTVQPMATNAAWIAQCC